MIFLSDIFFISRFPAVDSDSTAVILCSSGSTGSPKGISKSHKQLIHDFNPFFRQHLPTQIRVFQSSNIFWFTGIYCLITCTLFKSIRIITKNPVDQHQIVSLVNKYKVNACMIGPYVAAKILQIEELKPLESITDLMICGALLSKKIIKEIEHFIPNGSVFNCFGSSEQNFITISRNTSRLESCGVPVENMDIKVECLIFCESFLLFSFEFPGCR